MSWGILTPADDSAEVVHARATPEGKFARHLGAGLPHRDADVCFVQGGCVV